MPERLSNCVNVNGRNTVTHPGVAIQLVVNNTGTTVTTCFLLREIVYHSSDDGRVYHVSDGRRRVEGLPLRFTPNWDLALEY